MSGNAVERITRLDLNRIGKNRGWLIAAALLAAASIALYVAWRSGESELERLERLIGAARSEAASLEAASASSKGLEAALRESEKNVEALEAKLEALNGRLPSDRHISNLFADLAGNGESLRIVSIRPLPPEDRGELARLPFQISVEAPFLALGAYIEKIENLPRLMVIENIAIEAKEEGRGGLRADIFLSAFVPGYGDKG